MSKSFWGVFIIVLGVISIFFVNFFQNITNADEQNFNLLKETTESAMYDAFDFASYRAYGTIRIDREKFVENFLRRFAQNVNLNHTYKIQIYDVNETPPKVSIKVSNSNTANFTGETINFDVTNKLDAILETPY